MPGIWGELTFQSSKAELQVRRQESLQRLESRLQADQQAKLQRKQELDRCPAALSNSYGSKRIAAMLQQQICLQHAELLQTRELS